MKWLSTVAALSLALATSAGAQSGSTSVDTRSNLFLSGGNAGDGGGIAPVLINLNAGTSRVLTLSATGTATFCGGLTCPGTPEGGAIGNTDVGSSGLIAGISAPSPFSGFLAGVFLGAGLPAVTPGRLDFSGATNLASYPAPQLGQIFFIGNGLTTGGAAQQFFVPNTATRLFLGIADGSGFNGSPCCYDDNVGSYAVTYAVTGSNISPVPEPSTVALFAAGALVTFAFRRRNERETENQGSQVE